jgi:hypothetical protein
MTSRRRRRTRAHAAGLLAILVTVLTAGAAPAAAASACDQGSNKGLVTITIDEPRSHDVVSGANVVVRGSVRTVLSPIERVEATLAGLSRHADYDGGTSVRFEFTFDLTGAEPGGTTLSIVACGPLVYSRTGMQLSVGESTPITTSAPQATTTVDASPAPAGTLPGGTTSVPVSTTRAGEKGGPSTTAAPAKTNEAAAVNRRDPVRPRAGSDAPLVLTESPDSDSPRPPLWVGAVVGVSGGLGLLFSAASSSRRRARMADVAEPIDPDLVEVG